ncbi:MAG: hypothetical protein J6U25_00640 [Clostridia bacterium]|nr:hypothetical protein [Clostridia bacterium]
MKDDKAVIARLKEERKALVKALDNEREKSKEAERQKEEAINASKRRAEKLSKRESSVLKLENAANARYVLELKELKLFSDRVKRLYESGETIISKMELIDLFKDFLNEIDGPTAKEKVKAISEKLPYEGEEDSFDLDEILSSQGELDLKKLCEELGVLPDE